MILKLDKKDNGRTCEVAFAGDLTVVNATRIRQAILEEMDAHDELRLVVGTDSDVDISFLQILYSSKLKADAAGISLMVSGEGDLLNAVRDCGLAEIVFFNCLGDLNGCTTTLQEGKI